jgi:hypothetical protein
MYPDAQKYFLFMCIFIICSFKCRFWLPVEYYIITDNTLKKWLQYVGPAEVLLNVWILEHENSSSKSVGHIQSHIAFPYVLLCYTLLLQNLNDHKLISWSLCTRVGDTDEQTAVISCWTLFNFGNNHKECWNLHVVCYCSIWPF